MRVNPFDKHLTFEDREHIKVVEFLNQNYPDVLYLHVPNEGKKSPFEQFKHSLMGALKGCPDFLIFEPKYEIRNDEAQPYRVLMYHGLAIELKAQEHLRVVQKGKNKGKTVRAIGKLTPEQKVNIDKLNKKRYKACACWGSEYAIKVLQWYLS